MMIKKNELSGYLDKLIQTYQVFAPVERDSDTCLKQIAAGTEAVLDFGNTSIPPKDILFPQSETLFSYTEQDQSIRLEEDVDDGKKLIFAIRPCDARSFMLLDNVFSNDQYQDPYYLTRRANTVLVGLGCNEPCGTCFCDSVGGGPFAEEGLDMLLIDIGEGYVAKVLTDKGKEAALLLGAPGASREERQMASEIQRQAAMDKVNTEGLKAALDSGFYSAVWDLLHEKCIGCAACTYTCPTCHCFDIVDEAVDCNGCRIRNWDACMFPLFTLHGSGHNPRPTNKERFRQRVMHKFKYFADNFGAVACVGCGRCIINCPVNVDIRLVIADILKAGSEVDKK